MADNIPDYRSADELIRDHFRREANEFKGTLEGFMSEIGEWVYAAYLQGHEDGYTQGNDEGYNSGREEGKSEGYDEGYDDAKAEFEANEW